MTQEELFKKAIELNKETLTPNFKNETESQKEFLIKAMECYNNTIALIKTLDMTKQQQDVFVERACRNLYNDRQLSEIAFSICYLYKSEFDIKENADEKLDLLCNINNSDLKMSQIHIGIVKDLTIDEIKECMDADEKDIVEVTKQVFCRHYNKEYIGASTNEIIEEESR